MSSLIGNISAYSGVRIASVPVELYKKDVLALFVGFTLGLGTPDNVEIFDKKTPLGVPYKSAVVSISNWNMDPAPKHVIDPGAVDESGETPTIVLNHVTVIEDDGNAFNMNFHFHFDNGAPMNHIKLAFIEAVGSSAAVVEDLVLGDAWNSIYIPMVFEDFCSESRIKDIFEKDLGVGAVERVDFVNRSAVDGTQFTSAYVHFEKWFNTASTAEIRQTIETSGVYRCRSAANGATLCGFERNNRFLSFKMNHRPIPKTDVPPENIHQLASANGAMSLRIAELQDLVESMQREIYGLHFELSLSGRERPFVHAGCKLLTSDESELWSNYGEFEPDETGEMTVALKLPIVSHAEIEDSMMAQNENV